MSYRPFPGAPFLPCWSDGANICVREMSGRVSKYPCRLKVEIPEQILPFQAPYALWCLQHDGILYVGRDDFSFSGFREDGTLVRYGSWKYPYARKFISVGQCQGFRALLDTDDYRTIYVHDTSKVFLLHEPFLGCTSEELTVCDMGLRKPELTLYKDGREVDVASAGTWVSTPRSSWTDNPLQL